MLFLSVPVEMGLRVHLHRHLRIDGAYLHQQPQPSVTLQLRLNTWGCTVPGLEKSDSIVHLGRISSIENQVSLFQNQLKIKFHYLNPRGKSSPNFCSASPSCVCTASYPVIQSSSPVFLRYLSDLSMPLNTLETKANERDRSWTQKGSRRTRVAQKPLREKTTYDQ